ncbi:MAG: DUF2330 domain-containing protein [Polyangia bacterium]
MNNVKRLHISRIAGLCTVALVAAATAIVGRPGISHACGGLFCNSRPVDPLAPLPVAQTGENVVFAIDKDPAGGATTLTAHIQILYAGDAAKFSWVVPVDAVPTVSVGTDRLFSTLASVTQPQFTSQTAIDGECLPDVGPFYPSGMATGTGGSAASTGGPPPPAAGGDRGVVVSFQGLVGPYETAVISSTDSTELKLWLTKNGYIVSDQASGLIDSYVRDGKYFVALRLTNGAGVNTIQPVVLKFHGTEPCVPLRLTAIAANPDMQVRLWVLADQRAVPKNFLEMKIDDARIDWLSGGSNYNQLVKQAADQAAGNAFVAEYAGPSRIAAGALWTASQYNLSALQAAQTPPAYVQALLNMGLGNDSQTLVLLTKYIPMPAAVKAMGITDSQFYGNLSLYWSQYAFPAYDLAGLTTEVNSKIIEPRHVAQMMIDGHAYLTRLNTFISPEEMNTDPLFILNRDLPEVPLVRTAIFRAMCGNRQFMACNAPVRLELPDGRMAWVRNASNSATCGYSRNYDLSKLQALPALDIAWQREESGEGMATVDNSAEIRVGLLANNAAFPSEQTMFPIPSQGVPDATTDAGAPDGGGVKDVPKDVPKEQGGAGGCGCTVVPSATALLLGNVIAVMGVLGLALARRPCRRRLSRRRARNDNGVQT